MSTDDVIGRRAFTWLEIMDDGYWQPAGAMTALLGEDIGDQTLAEIAAEDDPLGWDVAYEPGVCYRTGFEEETTGERTYGPARETEPERPLKLRGRQFNMDIIDWNGSLIPGEPGDILFVIERTHVHTHVTRLWLSPVPGVTNMSGQIRPPSADLGTTNDWSATNRGRVQVVADHPSDPRRVQVRWIAESDAEFLDAAACALEADR